MSLPSPDHFDSLFDVKLPPAPYPGLRPFEMHEWPTFFGREKMTDEVINQLIQKHLVVVHGDSGCGKSSLIRAGVLAQLEQEHARSGVLWRTCAMLPRDAPLWGLAKALAELDDRANDTDHVRAIRRQLNLGADAPTSLAQMLRRDKDDHICILVDQFEELFAFEKRHGTDEARLFIDVLVSLQQNPPPGLYAILTMRSEFLGFCARYRGLAEAVNKTQYLLSRMERPALFRAIREPAPLYGGEVARPLAERLIADAGSEQDQLPLIQHGLMLLWRRKIGVGAGHQSLAEVVEPYPSGRGPDWSLDLPDYQDAGGLEELLSTHADEVMAAVAINPDRRKIVEHVFRSLTDINAEGHAVRRPQTLKQLQAVTGAEGSELRAIIDSFRCDGVSFLNPYGADPIEPNQQIDISHEALIRCWQKIADKDDGWLQREFNDGLIWKTLRVIAQKGETLSPAATEDRDNWLQTLPSPAWSKRYDGGWENVQRLLKASRKARDEETQRRRELDEAKSRAAEERTRRAEEARQAAAEIAAKEKELRGAQEKIAREAEARAAQAEEARQAAADSGRRFRFLAIMASVLALVALILGGWALHQQKLAATAQNQAEERAAAALKSDSLVRSSLAEWELDNHRVMTAFRLSLSSILDPPERPYSWRACNTLAHLGAAVPMDRILTMEGHQGYVSSVAFSPDGKRLVSGSDDNSLRLWDADTGDPIRTMEGHQGVIFSVAFSPDGKRLVSGSDDKSLRLWDAETGDHILTMEGHQGSVRSVAFSPDGKRLVSGSEDNSLRLWDAETGDPIRTMEGHQGSVLSVAFSPDGKRLVSGSDDKSLRLSDAETGHLISQFETHGGITTSIVFLDNERFLSASYDRYLDLWDIRGEKSIWTSRTREGGYVGLALDADKHWVAASTHEGRVWIYDVTAPEPRPVTRYMLSEKKAFWLDVSPIDGTIAVPLANGKIQILEPRRDLTWNGLVARAQRIAGGPLTDEDKRRLNLDE